MKKFWFLFLLSTSCAAPQDSVPSAASNKMSDADVWNQELRVLQQETPKVLNLQAMYTDFGYTRFPQTIFARKGKPTPEDRVNENMPTGNDDSAAHRFLMRLGQQIYQQALLAGKSGDHDYADNALLLIRKLVEADLAFMNDPQNPTQFSDNRYLEIGWFLSLLTRGARILDLQMPEAWQRKNNWPTVKLALNQWIGGSMNQNWPMSDALQKSPLDLAAQVGTMNWMGSHDTNYGATNRTFALLEAHMRIAEFRGGRLGPMRLVPNAWQMAQKVPLEHDGSIGQIFQTFRGYLKYYFNAPISHEAQEFVLNYDPERDNRNINPEKLNIEVCGDPLQLGYHAQCLLSKDAYRNDTYHAQMGLASILHIIDIAKRWGYELTAEEQDRVIMGLRWASFNNVPGVTAKNSAHAIAVWELAFRMFPASELGPYCERDLVINRSFDYNKKAALAWGYSRVALGF